jgi:hypothetical protein
LDSSNNYPEWWHPRPMRSSSSDKHINQKSQNGALPKTHEQKSKTETKTNKNKTHWITLSKHKGTWKLLEKTCFFFSQVFQKTSKRNTNKSNNKLEK